MALYNDPFSEVIHALRKSGKVNGVLVIMNTTDLPAHFSPDSSCPNTNFGKYYSLFEKHFVPLSGL